MELTPNEIRNLKFSSSMRGYNRAEVDSFMEAAATALEEARVALLKVSEEKESLNPSGCAERRACLLHTSVDVVVKIRS